MSPKTRLAVLLLATAVAAVFLPLLRAGFISLDDYAYVVENPNVNRGLTPETLRWAFTSVGYAANWHPLTWLSHALDVQLFGLEPAGHHLVNVLLHLAASLLLFGLLQGATGARGRSLLAAALFALHPLRVESVAWISERKDVLSLFLLMLALAAWLAYARRPSVGRYLRVLAAGALALLAKPSAVVLPLLLLILDWWPLGRLRRGTLRALLLEKAPFALMAAGASWLTLLAQEAALKVIPLPVRLGNALVSSVLYLSKTVWPAGLSIIYRHPGTRLTAWQVVAAAALLAALSAGVLLAARRRPYLAAGWLWYLVTLAPVLGLVQVGEQGMADRYTYLPHAGLFIALVWGMHRTVAGRPRLAAAAAFTAVLAVGVLSAAAWRQTLRWRESVTLMARAVDLDPGNPYARNHLGLSLMREGRVAEAAEQFSLTAQGDPFNRDAYNNWGRALRLMGRDEEAARLDVLATMISRGLELVRGGRVEEGLGWVSRAAGLSPFPVKARLELGAIMEIMGRLEGAAAEYREALRLDPGSSEARRRLEALGGSAR